MDGIKINVGNMTLRDGPSRPSPSPQKENDQEDIKHISAKLSPEYDQDLVVMISKIPKRERSKVYRDAVRFYLQSQGTK